MNTAKRASYFSLCEGCGGHGHIVCSDDGTESAEFATISKGLQELTALTLSEKISWDEALEVRRQIEASGLEPRNQVMDDCLEWIMEVEDQGQPDASDDTEARRDSRRKRTLN